MYEAPCKVGNQQITLSTLAPKCLPRLETAPTPFVQTHHEIMSMWCCAQQLHQQLHHQLTSNTSQEHHELRTTSAAQGQPQNTPGHKRSKFKKDVIFQSVADAQVLLGEWMAREQLNLSCPESPNCHHYKLDHFWEICWHWLSNLKEVLLQRKSSY